MRQTACPQFRVRSRFSIGLAEPFKKKKTRAMLGPYKPTTKERSSENPRAFVHAVHINQPLGSGVCKIPRAFVHTRARASMFDVNFSPELAKKHPFSLTSEVDPYAFWITDQSKSPPLLVGARPVYGWVLSPTYQLRWQYPPRFLLAKVDNLQLVLPRINTPRF